MSRLAQGILLGALVLVAAGCTTVTEELPTRPTQIPIPPPIVLPEPNPAATPTPAPNPAPTSRPDPPDSPDQNYGKVVKLYIKVFAVVCNGVLVPGSEFATSAKIGCQIYFDATAKDAANKPTTPEGSLNWTYSPMSLVAKVNEIDNWAPIVTGKAPGMLSVYAKVDGVQSQTLHIQLY
jgi:hypothetical protein